MFATSLWLLKEGKRMPAKTALAWPHTGGGDGSDGPPEARTPFVRIIPFPIARRVAFLDRMADCVASRRDPQAHLDRAAEQQRTAMRRRGLSEPVIEAEIAAFYREVIERMS
jgi:hypothetical protein